MKYGRRDNNHKEIVNYLRTRWHCTVYDMADVGKGFPDLVVGRLGKNFLIEVKSNKTAELTEKEQQFAKTWRGAIATVRNTSDVDALMQETAAITFGKMFWYDTSNCEGESFLFWCAEEDKSILCRWKDMYGEYHYEVAVNDLEGNWNPSFYGIQCANDMCQSTLPAISDFINISETDDCSWFDTIDGYYPHLKNENERVLVRWDSEVSEIVPYFYAVAKRRIDGSWCRSTDGITSSEQISVEFEDTHFEWMYLESY